MLVSWSKEPGWSVSLTKGRKTKVKLALFLVLPFEGRVFHLNGCLSDMGANGLKGSFVVAISISAVLVIV